MQKPPTGECQGLCVYSRRYCYLAFSRIRSEGGARPSTTTADQYCRPEADECKSPRQVSVRGSASTPADTATWPSPESDRRVARGQARPLLISTAGRKPTNAKAPDR